ncbi:MAG: glycosyltransferase [Clostridia bacterium]|nr:glycosyltransferase [Clostridia bacterium]
MKVLFIHSHKFRRINSKIYSLGGLSQEVLNRYIMQDNELTVIARIIDEQESKSNYSEIKDSRVKILNIKELKLKGLKQQIKQADIVILRLPCMIGNIAVKYIKKFKKKYLVEVVACAWDALTNHGFIGKLIAPLAYIMLKMKVKEATDVLYVSNSFLQSRYPTKGKNVACSDVVLEDIDSDVLKQRKEKLDKLNLDSKIVLGTCAAVNVKYKGQQYVIKAINKLKKQGINIQYELVGSGDNTRLNKLVKKYGLEDNVKFLGSMEHQDVFKWLDSIDIYIQPSNQEGLCRALLEAMSRACPCIASNAGGNPELIDKKYIFKKKNVKDLTHKLCNMLDRESLKKQSVNNFEKSKEYQKEKLEKRRMEFYKDLNRNE